MDQVFVLNRFLQYRSKSVHSIRTAENGDFIGVIFECGDAEIHDLRKTDNLHHNNNNNNNKKSTLLRLRNVIDFCFLSIPSTSVIDNDNNDNDNKTSDNDNNNNNNNNNKNSASNKYYHALLIARQNTQNASEYIRLGMFIEYKFGFGWIEIPISVSLHSTLYNNISGNVADILPFEIPINSHDSYILSGYNNIISMCSKYFKYIYVWRIVIYKSLHQCKLISPINIAISSSNPIKSIIITRDALFASDLNRIRISPAPSVLWNGQLELRVSKIYKLYRITSQLIGGINNNNKLFIFGVDRKNQNFKAFFVCVNTPYPAENIVCIPIGNKLLKHNSKRQMGWNYNKYLLIYKIPKYPQLYCVLLDYMFVNQILRSKDTKRNVKLINNNNNNKSMLLSTFSNTNNIISLYPDMILMPNKQDIHAFLFTFK